MRKFACLKIKNKRISCIFVLIGISFLFACEKPQKGPIESRKIDIVTTTNIINDVVLIIAGNRSNVKSLMGAGVDPHLYHPTQRDVRWIERADIVFYNGLHLEAKFTEVFENLSKLSTSKQVIPLGEFIPKKDLIISKSGGDNVDPHIWMNVRLWKYVAEGVYQTLSKLDPKHRAYYAKNMNTYLDSLERLDSEIREKLKKLSDDQRILVTVHDAFSYFGKEYGFYVKSLQGISTASKPGIRDIQDIAQYITDNKIKAIFLEKSISDRTMKAVKDAVKLKGWTTEFGGYLYSDSLGEKASGYETYMKMIRYNLETIIDALSSN